MKKKFLAIYALTGALVASPIFTSCVDDNESASVTAVRTAKAEQLKALAALSNAQAEAELINANAQKAIAEAEAKLKEAKANATAAEQARADQEFAAKLETIKAEAERDMWLAKKTAAEYEQQFNDVADERVKELYGKYKIEVGSLNTLLSNQISQKNSLAQLKAGIINTEEYAKIQNAQYDKKIADYEFEISLYEKYEGADLTKLKQDKMTAERDANKLKEPVGELRNAMDAADQAWRDLDVYNTFYINNSQLATVKAAYALQNNTPLDWNISRNLVGEEQKALVENDNEHTIPYYTLKADYVTVAQTILENNVSSAKDKLGVEATETTKATGLYAKLADNKNIVNTYEEELAAGKENLTYQEWEYDNAKRQLENINNEIPTTKLSLQEAEKNLADFKAAVKSFDAESEDWKAYEAAIANATTVAKSAVDAKAAYDKADEPYQKKQQEIQALQNLIDSAFDVEYKIAFLQQQIIQKKEHKQENLNSVSDKEAQIAQAEEQLKTYETQITAQKAIIANIEKAIKAAIGETEA